MALFAEATSLKINYVGLMDNLQVKLCLKRQVHSRPLVVTCTGNILSIM